MAANSFNQMITAKVIKRTDNGQFIGLANIHAKPGFNKRDKDADWEVGIQELVAFLDAGGEVPPLEVYARDDGGVWLVEGHRRTEAFTRLAAMGKPVEWIHIKQFNGNDAERIARIATSNSQAPLKPLERAAVYAELRALNWTPQDIARRMGKEVRHVTDLLALIDADTSVHTLVRAGTVAPTVAVSHIKEHGEKAAEVLAEKAAKAKAQALASGKAEDKARVTGVKRATRTNPILDGIEWVADGDANAYTLLRNGNWVAAVRLNGEMLVEQQEALLDAIFPRLAATNG